MIHKTLYFEKGFENALKQHFRPLCGVAASMDQTSFAAYMHTPLLGAVHKTCQSFLGGSGVQIADVCQLEGARGLSNADLYNSHLLNT